MRRYMWRMRVAFMSPELTSAMTETHDSDGAIMHGCLFWVSNRTCKAHTPAGRGRADVLCQPRPSIITARTPACHLLMPYCRCAVVTPRGSCSAARVRCPARSAHSVNVGPQPQRTSRGTAEEHMHAAIRSRRPHARAGYACDCVLPVWCNGKIAVQTSQVRAAGADGRGTVHRRSWHMNHVCRSTFDTAREACVSHHSGGGLVSALVWGSCRVLHGEESTSPAAPRNEYQEKSLTESEGSCSSVAPSMSTRPHRHKPTPKKQPPYTQQQI